MKVRKPRGEGFERRGEILQAARDIFSKEGHEQVTMRRIAKAAGLSPTGLYIYFKSKNAILGAIRNETFSELNGYAKTAMEGSQSAEERLTRHLRAYLDYARDHADAYRLTFRSQLIRTPRPGRPSTSGEARGREAFETMVVEISANLGAGIEVGPDELHRIAETTWAAIHGFTTIVIDVPGFPAAGLDQGFAELIRMVFANLRNR